MDEDPASSGYGAEESRVEATTSWVVVYLEDLGLCLQGQQRH